MNYRLIARVLGLLMLLYSPTLLVPLGVSLWLRDGSGEAFLSAMGLIVLGGLVAWAPNRNVRDDVGNREGFLVVLLFWLLFGVLGALPLMLASHDALSPVNALFEAYSGLTGTGSTVIADVDALPPSINYYRAQLCWLGGMGIVVLAIAVMPMLGIGGMALYRAESPGPSKDKLTPRITETAKSLWLIYVLLTALCAVAYRLGGMSGFDAIAHSFTTIATAGFSTHSSSFAGFNPTLQWLAILFMYVSALNFALHFLAFRRQGLRSYWHDPEWRFFTVLLLLFAAVTCYELAVRAVYTDTETTLRHGLFQATSLLTTTGFISADFTAWPGLLPVFLVALSVIGGCAGSTSSGMKAIRLLVALKQSWREVHRLIYPSGVFTVKVGQRPVHFRVLEAVWGFLTLYVVSFAIFLFGLLWLGYDFITAYGAVACSLNNAGAGLGEVGSHYGNLIAPAKLWLIAAMIMGRLEIFTLLVLLTPAFWKR